MGHQPQPNHWANFEAVRSVASEVLEYPPVSPVDVRVAVAALVKAALGRT